MNTFPTSSGIYRIRCKTTGKIYVGSAINLSRRWSKHRHALRNNIHPNKKLQNAWGKYTEDAFVFEILELVPCTELLIQREQFWFDTLRPFDQQGFNILEVAGSNLGHKSPTKGRPGKKHTPEACAKISAAGIGNTHTLGKKASPVTKQKMSAAKLGKAQSEEHIRKRTESRPSKKHTPETCEKIGTANRGRIHTANEDIPKMKAMLVTDPNGKEYTVLGINRFCKEHGINRSGLTLVAQGKQRQAKGWKARFPTEEEAV